MVKSSSVKTLRDWGIIQKKLSDGTMAWYARITRVGADGKKRQYTARADNKSHARRLRDELEVKYRQGGQNAMDGSKLRFCDLASIYSQRKLVSAEYHGVGKARRKVGGVRSLLPSQHYVRVLIEYFGNLFVKDIDHSKIELFKTKRLKQNSNRGERSIADVNRTLELLRAILRFAIQNKWLDRSPFEMGSPLISKADENRRERVLGYDEEVRLLAACDQPRVVSYFRNGIEVHTSRRGGREHLKSLIVVALDTAMRKGELLSLIWKDVEFEDRTITIRAENTKTLRERQVGMTPRVFDELSRLWKNSPADKLLLVFGIKDNFQNGFTNLLKDAKVEEFHFHDTRHTAITRMVAAGLPPMEVMKISGHTQWSTFARYVNPDGQSVRKVADVLSSHNHKMA